MADTRMASWTHYDCQDDQKIIAVYADIGIGPAVVFDGGGFMDPEHVRAFARDLAAAADQLEREQANG